MRATALRSLARSEAFSASDVIPERLSDPVPEVRLAALDALGALRADRSRARELLTDPDGLVRARAAGLLLEDARARSGDADGGVDVEGDAEAEAALARLTRSPHAEARTAAYRALASSRSAEAMSLARTGLADPTPSVRAEAAHTMTEVDPVAGIEEVIAAVDRGGDVLEAAGEAMARAPERCAPVVRRLAETATSRALESRRLGDSIDGSGDERLTLLRDSLLADSERQALVAIRAAGLLGGRGAISTALESLSADDPAQRANALEVIETIGDHDLVRPLLALWEPAPLADTHVDWRERLLLDPDDWIRSCAAWATEPARSKPDTGPPITDDRPHHRPRRFRDRDPRDAPADGACAVPAARAAVRRPAAPGPRPDRDDRVRAELRGRGHDRRTGRAGRRDAHHRVRLRDGDPAGVRTDTSRCSPSARPAT